MKAKFLQTIMIIALLVSASINLWAQEDAEAPTFAEEERYGDEEVWSPGPTFYQQVVDFLAQRGVTVTSVIDKPFVGDNQKLLSEIATAFRVSECSFNNAWTVGDVLCIIMEARYNGPHSEIMDFERIQYSSRHKDFEEYMNHYPNSSRWREAYEKYMVTFLTAYWNHYAMQYTNTYYYKDFLNKYKDFSDNYCRGLYDESEKVPAGCRLHTIDYEGYDSIAVCVLADAAEEYLTEILKAERGEEAVWLHATEASSFAAYHNYIRNYPRGQWYYEALAAMEPLELPDWQRAVAANTREGYEAFLRQYPDGNYAPKAARYIQDLVQAARHLEKDFCVTLSVQEPKWMEYAQVGIANDCPTESTYTLTYTGGTGGQVVLRPGETTWVTMIRKEYPEDYSILLENGKGEAKLYDMYIDKGVYLLRLHNMDFKSIVRDDPMALSKREKTSRAVKKLIQEGKQKFGAYLMSPERDSMRF